MVEGVREKSNVLDILRRAKVALNSRDVFLLKNLSNHTIHDASIYQDGDSIAMAVVTYSLSKVIERPRYSLYEDWPLFIKSVNSIFDSAISNLEKDDFENFRKDLSGITRAISKVSGNFKKHIKDIFRKAQISKASRIYEHGISIEQTASILGISIFELSEYAGKTGIADVPLSVTMPIEKRFKMAWEFFN